jgi:Ser/Thr protein kinase RdoA (MazF antagonist)
MIAFDGPLVGGTANRGRIVRVGDTVHRPLGEHSRAVHAFLNHLEARGFDGSPRVRHTHGDTEVLSYLPGTAANDPAPQWALTEDALRGVGALLQALHTHSAGFDGTGLRWQRRVPARWRGPLITHNDPHPANVIFRDERPVALIDFDLAAPSCRAWELAVAACFWIPLCDERDVDDSRQGAALTRLRALLDAYGASARLRREVVDATVEANGWISTIIESGARHGHPAFGEVWRSTAARYTRAHEWLATNSRRLANV